MTLLDVLETKPSLLQHRKILPVIPDKFKHFVDTFIAEF
ncbi:hypothetical protein P20439_0334 [Pseudoalteromonas sp. BSi20439]|nr:hypothetical protein P20439_0334 [Pseudoalteromonas sp. BSi20439]